MIGKYDFMWRNNMIIDYINSSNIPSFIQMKEDFSS